MLIDINSQFGEELPLTSAAFIGNALDTGSEAGIGAGANRPPMLHIVANTAVGAGTLEIHSSNDGSTSSGLLMSIPIVASAAETVLYNGILPSIPEGAGRYLMLKNASATTGKINAYVLNNGPVHHDYPGV